MGLIKMRFHEVNKKKSVVDFSIIRQNLRGMIDIKGPISPDMLFRGLFITSILKLYFVCSKP
jgi:hypothetical protein